MTDETICETLYKKLNSFVTNVINRDVTPKIDSLRDGKADNYHNQYTDTVLQSNALPNLGTNALTSQAMINWKINEKLGYWTTISNTESYVTTKASMITNNAWTVRGQSASVSNAQITLGEGEGAVYTNPTEKKVKLTLTRVGGAFVVDGGDHLSASGDELTYTLNPNQSISVISQTSSTLNYTVGTQSNIISSIIDVAYPVGSIYISSSTMHPSITFGGVWEHFAEDKFLLSAGSTYANGSTGGSATVTLTSAQSGMPAHSHKYQDYNTTYTLKTTNRKPGTSTAVAYGTSLTAGGGATERTSSNNTAANASQAHNNMPPYLAVYMWERVG